MNEPKILYWDIETSLLLLAAFTRYELRVPFNMVVADWFMFCAAVQWEGGKPILFSILDDKKRFQKDFSDDKYVIQKLRDMINEADILIAHNGDHFDWKKFKKKIIEHKIKPPRKPILIDTYKESKTAQFTSGKLGDLSIQLNLPHKSHSNPGDWLVATLPYGTYKVGSRKIVITKNSKIAALRRIGKYNLKDLPPLINLYKRIRPYMIRHPNMSKMTGRPVCPVCAGRKVIYNGYFVNGDHKVVCRECNHPFRENVAHKIKYKT